MIVPPIGSNPTPSTKKTKTTPTSKKSGGGSGLTLYRQPIFDQRMRTLAWPMNSAQTGNTFSDIELVRGVLVWDQATPYQSQPEVNFLFNPTTVTVAYNMDAMDVASTLMFRSPQDTAQAAFAMNQSVSISLYFDRTFELWGSYNPETGVPRHQPKPVRAGKTTYYEYNVMDPTVFGVDVDILAFKQVTGQLLQQYSLNGTLGGPIPNAGGYTPGLSQQGVMTMIPTWMFLGPTETGMSFYGYISDFTVTVTHFTQYMVPMRCVIDLDFALMMPPANEPQGPSFTDWMLLAEINQDSIPARSAAGKAGR